MINLQNNITLHEARKARRKAHPVLQVLIFIGLYLFVQLLSGLLIGLGFVLIEFIRNPELLAEIQAVINLPDRDNLIQSLIFGTNEWVTIAMLFSTIFPMIAAMLYCRLIEKRSLVSMGFTRGGTIRKYLTGYAVGIVMILITYLAAIVLGGVKFEGLFPSIPWGLVILMLIGFVIQGMSEEVMVRGYLMFSLANRISIAAAVAVSSIVFGVLHLMNDGITLLSFLNLILFGLFAALVFLRTDNIWLISGMHSSWNFVQGNVLGVLVSGNNTEARVFSTALVEGKELLSGGAFGLEGGLITTIVFAVAILLVLFIPQKAKPVIAEPDDVVIAVEEPRRMDPLDIDQIQPRA